MNKHKLGSHFDCKECLKIHTLSFIDTVLGEEKVCPNKGIANCICSQCYKMTGQPLTEGEEWSSCDCLAIHKGECKSQETEEITTTNIKIGMLRQYLNEDRKCTHLVTNEDIIFWLTGEKREPKKVKISCPECRGWEMCLIECICKCHKPQKSNKEECKTQPDCPGTFVSCPSFPHIYHEDICESNFEKKIVGCGECGNNIRI